MPITQTGALPSLPDDFPPIGGRRPAGHIGWLHPTQPALLTSGALEMGVPRGTPGSRCQAVGTKGLRETVRGCLIQNDLVAVLVWASAGFAARRS